MKKINSARSFTFDEKVLVLDKVARGESVSLTCRSYKISRTTLYRWLILYRKSSLKGYKTVNPRGFIIKRKIDNISSKNIKLLRAAVDHPDYSLRILASIAGISLGSTWKILKQASLDSKSKRLIAARDIVNKRHSISVPRKKEMIIKFYLDGESAASVCRRFGISRTIFYRWLRLYKKHDYQASIFNDIRPNRQSHWRYIDGVEKIVQQAVALNPKLSLNDLSILLLQNSKIKISRSGLYYVLKRLHLNTFQKRLLYANSRKKISSQVFQVSRLNFPKLLRFSFLSFLSPPIRGVLWYFCLFLVTPVIVFFLVSALLVFIKFYQWPGFYYRIDGIFFLICFLLGLVWLLCVFVYHFRLKIQFIFLTRKSEQQRFRLGFISLIAFFLVFMSLGWFVLDINPFYLRSIYPGLNDAYVKKLVERKVAEIGKGKCKEDKKDVGLCINKIDALSGIMGDRYVSQKGDTLWDIAERKYGSGYYWMEIQKANRIINADLLQPGMQLLLPVMSAFDELDRQSEKKVKTLAEYEDYVVEEDDTLWTIAEKFYGDGNKWGRILERNKLLNPDLIYAGDVLRVPLH